MRFDTTLLNRGHQGRLVLQERCGCRRHALLNFPGGKSPAALGTSPSSRGKKKAGNIITVPAPLLHRVGGAQSLAILVEQSAGERTGGWPALPFARRTACTASSSRVFSQSSLSTIGWC